VGIVLAVEVGLNDPHRGSLPQVTVQPTVPFCGPFVTVAAIPAVLPVFMEAGGVKAGVKVTTIAAGVELRLPQAARKTIRVSAVSTNAGGRNVMPQTRLHIGS
jgi:hypothetical protein